MKKVKAVAVAVAVAAIMMASCGGGGGKIASKIVGTWEYSQYGGVARITFHADGSCTFINMFNNKNELFYEVKNVSVQGDDGKSVKMQEISIGFKNDDGTWRNITSKFNYDGGDEFKFSSGEVYKRKQ